MGCHPTQGFRGLCFPPAPVESPPLRAGTQPFWICQSPAALGPPGLYSLCVETAITTSLAEPGSHSFLCSHMFCFSHAAPVGLTRSQDLSLCTQSRSFPLEKHCSHLWAEVAQCPPHSLTGHREGTSSDQKLLALEVLGHLQSYRTGQIRLESCAAASSP